MNNQKDTQKTGLDSYGQKNVLDLKMFSGKSIYELVNKKTEKIVTALYMVTDYIETDETLKNKIRKNSIDLLSDIFNLDRVSEINKQKEITNIIHRIRELVSVMEIASALGYISEMNNNILNKEFIFLVEELENHKSEDKHFRYSLDKEMFIINGIENSKDESNNPKYFQKDIKDKRTSFNNMSFTNYKNNMSSKVETNYKSHPFSPAEKMERIEKILLAIKDKELSIKDIALTVTDCSEKTIQRELNTLLDKGQIKKTGEKRWSKYIALKK